MVAGPHSRYRAIDFVTRLIDHGRLPRGQDPGEYRRITSSQLDAALDWLHGAGPRSIAERRNRNDAA
jgi:hypothetical protein